MSNIAGREDGLALKIAGIDLVIIDESETANPGCCEILQGRGADAAQTNHRDMFSGQRHLTSTADLGEHDMACKTIESGGRKR